MLITKDLLKVDPWIAICDMINDKYSYRLDHTSTELVELSNHTDGTSTITINRHRSNDPANLLPELTMDTFKFNKLNLNDLLDDTVVSGIELPTTTFKLIKHIANELDIVIVPGDVILGTVVDYDTPITITAADRSLRFHGSMTVSVSNNPTLDIGNYTNVRQASTNAVDNARELARINGSTLVYTFNFSEHHEYLSMIKSNQSYPDAAKLSSLLRATTGYGFSAVLGFSEFNLVNTISTDMVAEYKCLYNGPVIPLYTNRKDLSHVLVLELNRLRASNVVGNLIIHYNKG